MGYETNRQHDVADLPQSGLLGPLQGAQSPMAKHMATAIEGARLEWLPYPHIVVPNIFPDDVYENIHKLNPFAVTEGHEWMKKGEAPASRALTPYHHRRQVNFPQDLNGMEPEMGVFWAQMYLDLIQGPWFLQSLVQKFQPYFLMRFGELLLDPQFPAMLNREHFLQIHDDGYFIGPHTDVPSRILTCLFTFAPDESQHEWGTVLYRHKDKLARCSGRRHYGFEDFDEVKTATYRPNQLFVFAKTPSAFHAVKPLPPGLPGKRYGMQVQFYEMGKYKLRDLSDGATD